MNVWLIGGKKMMTWFWLKLPGRLGVYRDVDLHIYDQPSRSTSSSPSSPSSSIGLGFLFIANPCYNLSIYVEKYKIKVFTSKVISNTSSYLPTSDVASISPPETSSFLLKEMMILSPLMALITWDRMIINQVLKST